MKIKLNAARRKGIAPAVITPANTFLALPGHLRDIFADKEAEEVHILHRNLDWTIVYGVMLATGIGPGKPAKQNTQVLDCALSVYPLLEGLIQSENCTSVPEIVRRDGFAVSMIPQNLPDT